MATSYRVRRLLFSDRKLQQRRETQWLPHVDLTLKEKDSNLFGMSQERCWEQLPWSSLSWPWSSSWWLSSGWLCVKPHPAPWLIWLTVTNQHIPPHSSGKCKNHWSQSFKTNKKKCRILTFFPFFQISREGPPKVSADTDVYMNYSCTESYTNLDPTSMDSMYDCVSWASVWRANTGSGHEVIK